MTDKRIVLVVEDLPDEQTSARKAVLEAGFRPVIAGTMADAFLILSRLGLSIVGVISDLHFPEGERDSNPNKPCGFAVVARAVSMKLPVVVCSNMNHHNVDYILPVLGGLAASSPFPIPTVFDRKDWKEAVRKLTNLLEVNCG